MTLEMVNLHHNLMVTSEVPPAIQVRVVGSRSIVNNLSQARLTQTLDLSGYKSGRHTFSLGPNSFSLPRGVQVVRIQPNPITLTLASTMTRTLPIKPVLENNPAEGYELVSANTRPAQVTVKGPSPELAELKFIPTLPIDLSFLKEHTVIATDLDFKNLHLALKDPVPILADIQIGPKDPDPDLFRDSRARPIPKPPKSRRPRSPSPLKAPGPWCRTSSPKISRPGWIPGTWPPAATASTSPWNCPTASAWCAPAPPPSPSPWPSRHNTRRSLLPSRTQPVAQAFQPVRRRLKPAAIIRLTAISYHRPLTPEHFLIACSFSP